MTPLRCAIYARVSTADQHCEQQLTALRQYAEAHGWTVVGEYVDAGISGTAANRPEIDRLMEAARARKFDCVLVWKLDRWGRSVSACLASIQELGRLGVRWIATTQGLDTDQDNPMSRFMLTVMAAVASLEREMIRERASAGTARYRSAIRAGERVRSRSGKNLPIGRPRTVVDARRISQLRAEGRSIRDIAREVGVGKGVVASRLKH